MSCVKYPDGGPSATGGCTHGVAKFDQISRVNFHYLAVASRNAGTLFRCPPARESPGVCKPVVGCYTASIFKDYGDGLGLSGDESGLLMDIITPATWLRETFPGTGRVGVGSGRGVAVNIITLGVG